MELKQCVDTWIRHMHDNMDFMEFNPTIDTTIEECARYADPVCKQGVDLKHAWIKDNTSILSIKDTRGANLTSIANLAYIALHYPDEDTTTIARNYWQYLITHLDKLDYV